MNEKEFAKFLIGKKKELQEIKDKVHALVSGFTDKAREWINAANTVRILKSRN